MLTLEEKTALVVEELSISNASLHFDIKAWHGISKVLGYSDELIQLISEGCEGGMESFFTDLPMLVEAVWNVAVTLRGQKDARRAKEEVEVMQRRMKNAITDKESIMTSLPALDDQLVVMLMRKESAEAQLHIPHLHTPTPNPSFITVLPPTVSAEQALSISSRIQSLWRAKPGGIFDELTENLKACDATLKPLKIASTAFSLHENLPHHDLSPLELFCIHLFSLTAQDLDSVMGYNDTICKNPVVAKVVCWCLKTAANGRQESWAIVKKWVKLIVLLSAVAHIGCPTRAEGDPLVAPAVVYSENSQHKGFTVTDIVKETPPAEVLLCPFLLGIEDLHSEAREDAKAGTALLEPYRMAATGYVMKVRQGLLEKAEENKDNIEIALRDLGRTLEEREEELAQKDKELGNKEARISELERTLREEREGLAVLQKEREEVVARKENMEVEVQRMEDERDNVVLDMKHAELAVEEVKGEAEDLREALQDIAIKSASEASHIRQHLARSKQLYAEANSTVSRSMAALPSLIQQASDASQQATTFTNHPSRSDIRAVEQEVAVAVQRRALMEREEQHKHTFRALQESRFR
eukprot:TRINITY_DN4267_c6_g1_i1.p1 TRINITY_DN4267_c6_g1~~TRINITY_DN4267_c6_g1_i1.p1  ORF type:complete len:584 (+),score=163.59 TRINITY_DN4267_c6_g1_i1:68-1819(+)